MRVHVTGGDGFVGRHVKRALADRGHSVTSSGRGAALTPGVVLKSDLVIHAGACVGRERCAEDKAHAIAMNVTSTARLAEVCAERRINLLLVSSAEVYGNARGPLHESHLLGTPRNFYALTKLWAEGACRLLLPSELLSIARLGMQYGPGGRADTLSNFLRAAISGEELQVYRGARRSWTYVEDTARALALIAEASMRWREHGRHTPQPMVYNVDSGAVLELLTVAGLVAELFGEEPPVEVSPPPGYSDIPLLETERIRSLGWTPRVTLGDGIKRTHEWLRERVTA
jgi:nucleoside-diphosphate-sugar epimerase